MGTSFNICNKNAFHLLTRAIKHTWHELILYQISLIPHTSVFHHLTPSYGNMGKTKTLIQDMCTFIKACSAVQPLIGVYSNSYIWF